MKLQNGDLVKVRAYRNQVQVRRLVEVQGRTAIITTDEECKAAAREKRKPVCIGFPLADVIGVVKKREGSG